MNENSVSYETAPAPWELSGSGIILIYNFSKNWVEQFGQLPDHLRGCFKGGLGYIMLVNYEKSPVGPYKELLFIPGKFSNSSKQSITKIYVDSEASTQNGRANWGIPKFTLPMEWNSINGKEEFKMMKGDEIVFQCDIKSGGISFPVTTALLPIDLHQVWEDQEFLTKPSGSGWGKLAKVEIKKCNTDFFPPIDSVKPLLAVKVNPFHIKFPEPRHG